MNNTKPNNTKKTVHVKHSKSFANTRTGMAVDQALSAAITVAGGMLAAYATTKVIQKMEQLDMDHRARKFWTKAQQVKNDVNK